MRAIVPGLLRMTATAGCAAARNSPVEELAWERRGASDRSSTITLDRLDLDGRLVVNGYEVNDARLSPCVREAAADQIRRGAGVKRIQSADVAV